MIGLSLYYYKLTLISLASLLWDIGNSIAPDVTPQNAASHLGLFYFEQKNFIENDIRIKNYS